jgi:pimeloyl-ACP methyl ester carboxylesterase
MEQSHQLRGLFASRVGQPKRTYLFGTSLGGLIGLLLAQKYPGLYDGTMLVSGVVGGTRGEIEYIGDIRVLFDVVYPNVLPGGLEHPPVITDVNAQVLQPVSKAIQASPGGVGVILSLARHRLPGNNLNEILNSLVTVLVFSMQGGGDLFDRTHEHTYFDNADWHYSGAGIPPAVEQAINQQVARYRATPDAIAYLDQYGEPGGSPRTPILSIHTTRDPVVPAWHEDRLGVVNGGPWLLQRRTDRYGHVAFAVPELMANFDDLVAWVRSGEKPAL